MKYSFIFALSFALGLWHVTAQTGFTDANWTSIGGVAGADGTVNAAVLDAKGNLYIGGFFADVGGVSASCVAKWDGTNWSALGSGMAGGNGSLKTFVVALAFDTSGNLYASGNFTAAGGVGANYIAKWDGTNWSAVGSGLNYVTYALAGDKFGNIYAGGIFNQAGGVSAKDIAKWNGTNWSALGAGMGNGVFGLTCDNSGNLYAVGYFASAGTNIVNSIAKWDGTNWYAIGGGLSPGSGNATVFAVVTDGLGNLYTGGYLTGAGGVGANDIAKWNGTNWSALGAGLNGQCQSITFDAAGNLYAGGYFTGSGGVSANYIAKWDGTNWSALGSGAGPVNPYTYINTLAFDKSGNLYVGGSFSTAGTNTSATYIAKALLSPSSSLLAVTALGGYTNIITGLGTPGNGYALELATNLTPPVNWQPQATNVSSDTSLIFTNVSGSPQGFYRTRFVP